MIVGFEDYQEACKKFASYPKKTIQEAVGYLGLGLVGEAGEVANKLKKYLRGDYDLSYTEINKVVDEIGDILWYCSELCSLFNIPFYVPFDRNIEKLEKRLENGTIRGSGDER